MIDGIHDNRNLRDPSSFDVPEIFLNYQKRWIEDESDVKIGEKSRRVGFSWCEAGDDALLAARANGMDVFYISYNQDMTRQFIEDCADWSRFYNLAAGEVEDFIWIDENAENKGIHAFRIVYPGAFKIIALSSRPSNLRSKQGKVVIDEAAFVDDLRALLKAAMAFLMWGGKVVIFSTHFGEDNPFNELILSVRAGKKPYSLHRVTIDDAIADGLYKRICLRLNKTWSHDAEIEWRQKLFEFYGDDADEELLCIPSNGSGIYFPRTLIKRCMSADRPVISWHCKQGFEILDEETRCRAADDFCHDQLLPILNTLDPNARHYFGEDFGRSGDLTDIWTLEETTALRYVTPFICELRNVPFQQQKQILFFIIDHLPNFSGGALDARGNGQYLAEVTMQKYGEHLIKQVMLSNNWYRENMPKYKAAYEDNNIEIPEHIDILEDHRAITMIKGIAKPPDGSHKKGSDGHQRHSDSAVAGALAIYAVNSIDADTWDDDYGAQTAESDQYEGCI